MLSHRYLEYAQEAGHFQITPAIYPESITVPASLALSELVFVSTISCAFTFAAPHALAPATQAFQARKRESCLRRNRTVWRDRSRLRQLSAEGSPSASGGVRRSYSNCGLRQISNQFHVVNRSRLRHIFRLKVGGVTQEGGVRKSFSKFYLGQISHRFHVTSIMTSVALGCGFTVSHWRGRRGRSLRYCTYLQTVPSNMITHRHSWRGSEVVTPPPPSPSL